MKNLLVGALLLAASCGTPPEVLPPPFGPEFHRDTHLFFPTGMAVTPGGALLVANGNFDHRYDAGTVVGLTPSFVSSFFQAPVLQCDVAENKPEDCDRAIPPDASAVMIGSYAGPMLINQALAFTASRDSGVLNAVAFDATGTVSCAAGTGTTPDCRTGLINLRTAANIDGPYSIVPGDFLPPDATSETDVRSVLFVSSIVPHIDAITSGTAFTSSQVAALDMSNPGNLLFAIPVATALIASGAAPGPMVFDPKFRRLYLAGCYERFTGTGAGEPGTGKCLASTSNLLRVVDVDARESAAPRIYNLYADARSNDTTQLVLAEPDATTGAPHALWATMRNSDMLVRIELPPQPSTPPRVTRAVPLAITPTDMLLIPRPGMSDLLAIVSERSSNLVLYDTGVDQIVGQVDRLGDQPFGLARFDCPTRVDSPGGPPSGGPASACLAVTVFNECRVAFVEVPLAAPWTAALRGRAGGCL